MTRALAALPLALLLAGCTFGGPQQHADAVTVAECNRRADEIYGMRHPGQVFTQDAYAASLRDAPLGTSGTFSNPSQGLSGQYERAQIVRECIDATGPVGPTPAAPPVAAPAAPQ